MPQRKENNQPDLLDKLLGGRDAKGRFLPKSVVETVRRLNDETSKYEKISEKASKQVNNLMKALLKNNKGLLDAAKRENTLIQSKSRLQAKTIQLTNRLRDQRIELERGDKAAHRFGLSLRTLGLAGLGYAAFRRFSESVTRQLDSATVGPDILKRIGPLPMNSVAADRLLEPISKVLASSASLRYGATDQQLQGLTKAINSIRGIGVERAGNLVSDFVTSLEPIQKRAFLSAIQASGLDKALTQFSNLQNVDVATSLKNAIEFQQQSQSGKLDPILSAAQAANESLQELDKAFIDVANEITRTVLPALRGFNSLSPSMKTGLTGAGLVGAGLVGTNALAIPALRKGLAKGVSLGSRPLIAGGSAVVGAGLSAGGRALNFIRGGLAVGGRAIPAGGVAIAAAMTARDYGRLYGESKGLAADRQRALQAVYGESSGAARLGQIARLKRQTATTQVEKKVAERLRMDSLIVGSPSDFKGLARLREQRQAVNVEIQQLRARATAEKGTINVIHSLRKAFQIAGKEIQSFSRKTKSLPLPELQQRAMQLEELQLPTELRSTISAIKRQEKAFAEIGPMGPIGAFGEMRVLNDSIREEIDLLNKQYDLQDRSTTQGQIEANKLLLSIRSLETEVKSNLRNFQQAILDNSIQQALGAGSFTKILLTSEQNLMRALQAGVGPEDPELRRRIYGNIDPTLPSRMPIRAMDVLGLATQPKKRIAVSTQQPDLKTLLMSTAKAFNQAAKLLTANEQELFEPDQNRLLHVQPGNL
ncbi:hypothetical protein C4585_01605 [Candidatus Parcubacteria bacterium]|nr:MAG: hypothetical protein C4585_01605 [Candidatus Parcubacteria bacterium]